MTTKSPIMFAVFPCNLQLKIHKHPKLQLRRENSASVQVFFENLTKNSVFFDKNAMIFNSNHIRYIFSVI